MRKISYILLVLCFIGCKKYDNIYPTPCDGNCGTTYGVVYENQNISPNPNGYYEIHWNGSEYFQITGRLTPVREQYIINKVPLVEAKFDSDYWVVFDTLLFQTPMYSYLGWFNDNTLNTPIPFGNYTYTLNDLIGLHPPTNIVGYQIPKYFCTECPYAPTLVGTYSKYTYNPTQNILLDNEMIGDTINIFIESMFNTDIGGSEIVENHIKVIIL
jgi:hypothetical protein